MRYLLDSTVLIDHANRDEPAAELLERLFSGPHELYTCDVVTCETLSQGDPDHLRHLRVLVNALDGRDAEFNDWYNHVHIRDCMRMPGAVAVQRFALSPNQFVEDGAPAEPHFRYLSLYEWEDNRNIPFHGEWAFTEKSLISEAGDMKDITDYYFEPVILSNGYDQGSGFRVYNQALILAQIQPTIAVDEFETWFGDRHITDVLALPGIATAGLFRLAEDQLVTSRCGSSHIAVYGASDLAAAISAWGTDEDARPAASLRRRADVILSGFSAMIPRLTAKEVQHPPLDQAIKEIEARRGMKRMDFARSTSDGINQYVFTGSKT